MGEVIGYLVVLSIIVLLTFELIRQSRELKASKEKNSKVKRLILIYSLFGLIFFYSLNALVATGVLLNEYITSNNTAFAAFTCFQVHIVVKFFPHFFKSKMEG